MRVLGCAVVCALAAFVVGCGSSDVPKGAVTLSGAPVGATPEPVVATAPAADSGAAATAAPVADRDATTSRAAGARAGAPALLTAADRASFSRLGATLPGTEGVAVAYLGLGQTVYRAGSFTTGVAWSTSKPAVAMAAIGRGTASATDLKEAITASDNAAAERLWSSLGSSAATDTTAQVRAAGDSTTVIQAKRLRGAAYTAFGQTDWSLTNEVRFVGGMGCTPSGKQVLGLMRKVIPSQRWGLGHIGTNPAFKGGWGPGIQPGVASGWLDRQMGIVTIGGKPVAVAIASTAGDHAGAAAALTKIAAWLKTHVDTTGAPSTPRCG